MPLLWSIVAPLLALIGACTPTGSPPQLVAEEEAPRATPVATGPEYLLWRRLPPTAEGAPGYETIRIDADGAIIGRADGMVVAGRDQVWRLVDAPVEFTTPDCGERFRTDGARPVTHTARHVQLHSVADGTSIELVAPATSADPLEDFVHHVEVSGSVGSWLFVEAHESGFWCGAHMSTTSSQVIFDLDTGAQRDPITDSERVVLLTQYHDRAFEDFAQIGEDLVEDAAATLQLSAVFPRLERDRIVIALQFTADTCYACGDRMWGDYSISTRFDATSPPAALARALDVPIALHPRLDPALAGPAGFTTIDATHPQRGRLDAVFVADREY